MSRGKKICGVYKVTAPDGKIYVGSSIDVANRWCSYKRLKCKSQTLLLKSLQKYGPEAHKFEIIEKCDSRILEEREYYYGMRYHVLEEETGLNSRLPKVSNSTVCISDSMKKKISKANKGRRAGVKIGYRKSKRHILSLEQVAEIKRLLFDGVLTEKEIGNLFNVQRSVIKNICTGKSYPYVSPEYDLSKRKPTYIKIDKEKDWPHIVELHNSGYSQKKIADMYNVDPSNISRIINKKYKQLKTN